MWLSWWQQRPKYKCIFLTELKRDADFQKLRLITVIEDLLHVNTETCPGTDQLFLLSSAVWASRLAELQIYLQP